MGLLNKNSILVAVIITSSIFGLSAPTAALAASTPSLGTAATFAILSSTFIRNVGITAITGDLGYTTLGGSGSHTVTAGTTSTPAPAQAGIDQAAALTALNTQSCDFSFGSATDLSLLSQPLLPGTYCISAAASIGTGGITLNGSGTYIFRITGALTTVANSVVTVTGGASVCDVFWAPTAATTLGANSTFRGTAIDDAGITIGNTVGWLGRALAFGGTVTADTDTITAPTCGPAPASIKVIKTVINNNGGTKVVADFPLFVNGTPVVSGVTNVFGPGAYTVTETGDINYSQSFSGDCDGSGHLTLIPGNNKVCILTNNDILPSGQGSLPISPPVPPLIDVVKIPNPLALPAGPGAVTYTYTLRNIGTVPVSTITMVGDSCSPILLISGDTNGDANLDVNETWTYRCSTTLSETHTNTVVATGWANGLSATDIASATVVVGQPVVPPLIHVTKIPNPLTLLAAGGMVTYTETVTNPGTVPLNNVRLTDDKCDPVRYVSGDMNSDSKLDPSETWVYTCATYLNKTTTNTAVATGEANGLTVRDFAIATVVVAPVIPGLPNTGLSPEAKNAAWIMLMLAGSSAVFILLYIRRKKQVG